MTPPRAEGRRFHQENTSPPHRRWPRRVILGLLLLVGLLLVWQLAVEIVEPHLLLYVDDWLRPKPAPLEVDTVGGTTLRLYSDTRPHVGKIAGLQKGLVWVDAGRELVEEGYGFGCPIVEADGQAYLSRQAETWIAVEADHVQLIKRYIIDTMDTPVRPLHCKYCPVEPLGVVTVRYDIYPGGTIEVEVDLNELPAEWDRVFMMNEQGAHRFTRYHDDQGVVLTANTIGIWQRSTAERACWDGDDGRLSFCVELVEPAVLYVGRERYNQYNWRGIYYLSWSGIDVEVSAPRDTYRYRILLEAR